MVNAVLAVAMTRFSCVLLIALPSIAVGISDGRGVIGQRQEGALLQTWGKALDGTDASSGSKDTPVTRVVKLLEEMKATLTKEMEEDAALYDKLACWCNNNEYEKTNAIKEAEASIADLTSSIEADTAKVAELKTTLKQLEEEIASNKKALAEATAMREKEAAAFHEMETESIQNIENLKAAILVLSRHHGASFPQLPPLSWNFLQGTGKRTARGLALEIPWDRNHESQMEQSFDSFLTQNGFDSAASAAPHKFLQQSQEADEDSHVKPAQDDSHASGWSTEETSVLQKALRSATKFLQATHSEDYYPSYKAKSGEILGILNELKDQMTANLSEAQQEEARAAATFADMRTAKTAEIESAEKQAESKEDLLAKTAMNLAESKEDLEKTQATLAEDQKFMKTLKETCGEADKNFETRKSARLAEIEAVSQTIAILASDDAKDLFKDSFSFMQVSSARRNEKSVRREASTLLRGVAAKVNSPELSILATSVELDAFTRVKKIIDKMIAQLKVEQADEVKKHDWCNTELQENEMATMKAEDKKAELNAKVGDLGATLTHITDEIAKAQSDIAQLQLDLQRASENRKKENMDFQSTVADQRATQSVLKTALERLAKYYDEESLVQAKKAKEDPTPPVPQMEYSKSGGASGVMSMIEKLVHQSQEVEKDARHSEVEAQAQYEALVAETFSSIKALSKQVMSKTQQKAQATKEKGETEGDLVDTDKELEDLSKYEGELHGDCDFLIKNFGARQEGRSQEIEALQQAKQILSGAMSS
jgi:hypothetical protein